jgi:predicted nucleotidyltransferase
MDSLAIALPLDRIEELCRRWKVRQLAVFGSLVSGGFRPESDVDFLVTFDPDAGWDLWDLVDMRQQFQELLGREVDLVEERSLRNPYRRRSILRSKRVVCAAD